MDPQTPCSTRHSKRNQKGACLHEKAPLDRYPALRHQRLRLRQNRMPLYQKHGEPSRRHPPAMPAWTCSPEARRCRCCPSKTAGRKSFVQTAAKPMFSPSTSARCKSSPHTKRTRQTPCPFSFSIYFSLPSAHHAPLSSSPKYSERFRPPASSISSEPIVPAPCASSVRVSKK